MALQPPGALSSLGSEDRRSQLLAYPSTRYMMQELDAEVATLLSLRLSAASSRHHTKHKVESSSAVVLFKLASLILAFEQHIHIIM